MGCRHPHCHHPLAVTASRAGVDLEHPAVTPCSLHLFRSTAAVMLRLEAEPAAVPPQPLLAQVGSILWESRGSQSPKGFTLMGATLHTPKCQWWQENLGAPGARGSMSGSRVSREYACAWCYLQRTNTGRSIYSLVSMYLQVYLSTHIYSSDTPLILYCVKMYIKNVHFY